MERDQIGKAFWEGLIVLLVLLWVSTVHAEKERVVARVNGTAITQQALRQAVAQKIPPGSFHGGVPKQNVERIAQEALEELIQQELQVQAARKMGLKIGTKDVNSKLTEIKKRFPNPKAYQQALKKAGLTEKELRQQIERDLLLQKVQENEIRKKSLVNDQELKDYYNRHREQFVKPESVHLRQILIGINPGSPGRAWEEAEKRSRELLQRIQKGEDFAALAKQHSTDEASKEAGGDLGIVHQGMLSPEVEKVAFSLPAGAVGGPVRSIYGFHLIKVEKKQPRLQLDFSQVDKELLRKEMVEGKMANRKKEWVQALKSTARIQVFEEEVQTLTLQ